MDNTSFLARNRQWFIFYIMSLASLVATFNQVGLSSISGEVAQSLNANAASLGALVAAFSYSYAAMQVPVGLLVDTLGSRKTVTAALCIATIGTFIFASASSVSAAIIGRICIGIGTSALTVPLLKLTAMWFPPKSFATLTAFAFAFSALGTLVATSPMALVSHSFGWRNVFYALALITFVMATVIYFTVRDTKDGKAVVIEKKQYFSRFKVIFTTIVSNKAMWLLAIYFFCQGGMYFALTGLWSGQFLIQGMGMSLKDASIALTFPASALLASPLFTWLANKLSSQKLLLLLSILSVVFALPFALGFPQLPLYITACYLLIYGMLTIGGAAVIFDEAAKLFPVEYAGTVSGFTNVFPILGGAVWQQCLGVLVENNMQSAESAYEAFTKVFMLLPAVAVLSLVMIVMFIWMQKGRKGVRS